MILQFLKNKRIIFNSKLLFFILFFTFIFSINTAEAVILYLEPDQGDYYQEDIFIIKVKLDTEGETINAVEVELSFPSEIIKAINVSRGDSVFPFWPEEPLFSNEKGIVSFIGGIPLGFNGQGNLLSIPFQVTSDFDSVNFIEIVFNDNSQVLLNDGLGSSAETIFKEAGLNVFPEKAEVSKNEWFDELEKDNNPPESFEIILGQDPLIFDGQYFITFFTTDAETGIDYYEIKEGNQPWKKGKSPYLLEDQSLKNIIKVKAFDKAGNETIAELIPPKKKPFYQDFFLGSLAFLILILIIISIFLMLSARKRKKI